MPEPFDDMFTGAQAQIREALYRFVDHLRHDGYHDDAVIALLIEAAASGIVASRLIAAVADASDDELPRC